MKTSLHPSIQRISTPSTQGDPKNILQRSTLSAETATHSTGTASQTQAESEETDLSTPQVDLDELARRVYLDIKRKLALEWERNRQRG
jgi:hypothetical protein